VIPAQIGLWQMSATARLTGSNIDWNDLRRCDQELQPSAGCGMRPDGEKPRDFGGGDMSLEEYVA
jgi:hypothetical protein